MKSESGQGCELSFVIPAHGESPYLEQTVESLQQQETVCPFMIRWVQRPSSRRVTFSSTIPVRETSDAQGIGGDWDAALQCSATMWTTLAHADDSYAPQYASAVLEALRGFPSAGIVFTDAGYGSWGFSLRLLAWLKARINPVTRWRWFGSSDSEPRLISASDMSRALRWGCFMACPTVAYRRDVFQKGPLFSTKLKTALDWKAWLDLADRGVDFVFIPRKLVTLKVHSGATTQQSIQSGVRAMEEWEIVSERWGALMTAIVRRWLLFGQWLQQVADKDRKSL